MSLVPTRVLGTLAKVYSTDKTKAAQSPEFCRRIEDGCHVLLTSTTKMSLRIVSFSQTRLDAQISGFIMGFRLLSIAVRLAHGNNGRRIFGLLLNS